MRKKMQLVSIVFFLLVHFSVSVAAEEMALTEESIQESQPSVDESQTEESSIEESSQEESSQSEVSQPASDESPESSSTTESSSDQIQESSEQSTFAEDTKPFVAEIGTAENPYLVTNFSELKQALAATLDSEATKYIQFQNDIVYDGTATIKQNTVIDGNGFALLYNGTNYGGAHFSTGANNISVTYKNLSFGNSAYPNSTYYGILFTGNSNVHFTVENINYNIKIGGQPFWGNNDAGNTLEIRGQNQFYSSGSSYGGEFVEGFRNVLFAEGSNTSIYNDTPTALAIFWSTAQTVTIAKKAVVSIETSKRTLFYGDNATLNIQEQAEFRFKKIYGTNNPTNDVSLTYGGTLTGNLAEDSLAQFTTDTSGFSGNSPSFNLSSPDYLVFENSSAKQVFASGFNPKLTRKDTDADTYGINYLTAGKQTSYLSNAQTNTTYTMTTALIENGYSMAYSRMPKIDSMSATPEVAADVSSIHGQIDAVTPSALAGQKVQYKLAAKKLYSGADSTDETAQTSIEQATEATGVLEGKEITLDDSSQPIGADTKATFNKLFAGGYYLYAKVEGSRIPGYTFQSPWQEVTVEVPKFILTQFSHPAMAFQSPVPGQFGKERNLDEYTVRNAGNVPTTLSLKRVTRDPESASSISLVEQFVSHDQELLLSLIAEKADSKEKITLGPLIEKEDIDQPTIALNPFWASDNQAALYFNGNYSGPMIGPQTICYHLSFAIAENNTSQEE